MDSAVGQAARAAGDGWGAIRRPPVLVLALLALAGLALDGFVTVAPNRLLGGVPVPLWQAADLGLSAAVVATAVTLGVASLLPDRAIWHAAVAVSAASLLGLGLATAGTVASEAVASGGRAVRVSLGAGFWTLAVAAPLVVADSLARARAGPLATLAAAAAIMAGLAVLGASGRLDDLSIMREWSNRRDAFAAEAARHAALVFGSLAPALAIGAALGVAAWRRPRAAGAIFAAVGLLQTVPSIALFALLIGPLTSLADAVPWLRRAGVAGIGAAPAIVALTLYGLLPVVRGVQAGLAGVPASAVDAARGLGMTPGHILLSVSLPLALPSVLAGLRIASVQAVGLAAVGALIGAGGLGAFVFQGLGQTAVDLVLLGALAIVAMALALDTALRAVAAWLERRLR